MKKLLTSALFALALVSCSKQVDYTAFVDTSIGTGGHGHVFVGANVPFGAVQLGPTSVPQSWDWCSGYHVSDSTVIGFSHTHLSGTGIGDLFDVTILPVKGTIDDYSREAIADKAIREKEISVPGYYSVPLQNADVLCEMTATERVGLSRYIFSSSEASLLFNLRNGGCWDRAYDVDIQVVDDTHIVGHRHSHGWANDQKLWFAAEFSAPFTCTEATPMHWRFDFPGSTEVLVKVALSPASEDAAVANMAAELPGWNFEAVKSEAKARWNAQLSKIKIDTDDAEARTIFYTALYHSMIAPSLYCDCGEPERYTTFSLWDTYRAAHPLYSIIHPDRLDGVINSFLDAYDRQGDLPVWHLMGCETDCMVGNPGVCVTADAMLKGFKGFDPAKAYEAMKRSATTPDRGQDLRMKYGFIPCDLYNEGIANDMEYAIADWAIAQVALQRGENEDYEYYLKRSQSYRNYFDPSTRFMRGRMSDGSFRKDFNPFFAQHRKNDYCEGNAWQYTWLVPHDFEGLLDCFGSSEALVGKLDSLFVVSSQLDGDNASKDISGLIGQYAHGNEPSHHIVYFYTLAGQPWKTADLLRRIYSEMYKVSPDGLCGNEDVGQMSAWYILSTMGIYQVEPAGGRYYFGSPLFKSAEIALPDGKSFRIVAENNSDSNRYIQSVELNGRPYERNFICYEDIMAGGELRFVMGSEPYSRTM